jgi:glycosyltransferase involved in cell wall biosynthesis
VSNLVRLDRKNRYVVFYANASHVGQFSGYKNVQEVYVPFRKRLVGSQMATLVWDQISAPWHARKHDADVIFHAKFAVPLLTRRKTVMVLHGTERFFYPQFSNAGDMLFFRTVYPWYLKRATAIIAVSNRGREDIIKQVKIDPAKVTTVHLAISPMFRVIKDTQVLEAVRRKYQLPPRFILHVGHIYPGKNFGGVLRALARVREHADLCLVNVGTPRRKYSGDLELIGKLGLDAHVILAGYAPQEDLVAMYNLAELVAFPSIYESFPAIPLEANACGCPVVTSPTGGTPESAGEAALYVDPKDEAGLCEAILRMLADQDLRQDLVSKGFQNVKRFSWEITANRTLDVLGSLGPHCTP